MYIQRIMIAWAFGVAVGLNTSSTAAAQNWSYTYNSNGQVLTVDGPRTDVNDTTTYTYNAAGHLATITNALGQVTQLQNYNGRGQPGAIIDANGVETVLTYHPRGWLLTSTVKDPSGNPAEHAVTTYEYDNVGQIIRITLPDGTAFNYDYDGAHRLIAVSNSLNERIEYTLDAAGNRTTEVIKSATGAITKTLSRTYDELNRVLQIIGANYQTTTYSYDDNGNVAVVEDGNAYTTVANYDALDRLINQNAPLGHAVDYLYDARGNLTTVQDPNGLITSYSYDGFNNLTQQNSPDTGATDYTYDAANNRLTQADANGIVVNYNYDELNRLTHVSYPNSALNVTYGYDAGPYGKGRLTSIADATGATHLNYDHRGNLITQTVYLSGGATYVINYAYDLANQLTGITYPDGRTVNYVRDATGQVAQVDTTADSVTQTLASNLTYKPFGPLQQLDYGNGIQLSRTYDQDYRLGQQSHGLVKDTTYSYDNNDNITAIADNLNMAAGQSLSYDALNRLTNANGIYGTRNYTYDASGNRLTYTDSSGTNYYTYDATSHRLLATDDWNCQYDNNGNRISKLARDGSGNGLLYLYDDHNRLVEVRNALNSATLAVYAYNAHGQRAIKTTPTKTVHYLYGLNGELLAEIDPAAGGGWRDYIYLNGEPLAVVDNVTQPTPLSIMVDDHVPSVTTVGNWETATAASGYQGEGYHRHDWGGSSPAGELTWPLNVSVPGDYEVYARWPADASHTTSALYTLTHVNGAFTANINQQQIGGQWLSGGVFALDANSKITLSGAAPGYLVGDGVQVAWADTPANDARLLTTGIYYVHNDHLGTPQVLTDQAQNIVWGADYEPFGEVAINTSTIANNLRFPGQYFDEESGLHYNYFRDYDPATGRYVQSDPIGLQGGINTYTYVINNPLRYIDPFGLKCWTDSYGQTVCDSGSPYSPGYCPSGDCAAYPESANNYKDKECMDKCRKEKVWISFACDVMGADAGAKAAAASSAAGAVAAAPIIGAATSVAVSKSCGMFIEQLVCSCDEEETSCPVK